jgi:nucleotide-binding universal stress UspA family protein
MLARLSASHRNTHNDCVVFVGRPADTIASLAVEYGAGLVVMGLANRDDSEQRPPGAIAYRVLRLAHVAVVVVPAPPHEPLSAASGSLRTSSISGDPDASPADS